jgi:hypothetical protein
MENTKLEQGIDVAIAVLTKSTALAAVAEIAATGLLALFKKHGVAIPDIPQAELNAAMVTAANQVVANAEDLKVRIRAEFGLPPV